MVEEFIKLMKAQEESLGELLVLLDLQFKMIINKDTFALEGVVDELEQCSKKIAKEELERRNLIGKNSMSQLVKNSDNQELKNCYKSIREILKKSLSQKETNEILLKQQMIFNTKMLNIINPNREIKTYNSYGNLSR